MLESLCNDCFDFYEDWLEVEDFELKILMLVSVLGEYNLGYNGNLKDMCKWLGVTSNSTNNKKIKAAISCLDKKGLLICKKEGRRWLIGISDKGLKDTKVKSIRKCWIDTFKSYNKDNSNHRVDKCFSLDWINIVRVFVYLWGVNTVDHLFTMDDIANSLGISRDKVSKALKAIKDCNGTCGYSLFTDKPIIKNNNGKYRAIGTIINLGYDFESM